MYHQSLLFLEPLIAVTIFTIELLPHNRTLYKLCGRYNNSVPASDLGPAGRSARKFVTDTESRERNKIVNREEEQQSEHVIIDVACENEEAVGHYIFVRDDRKKVDYFTLCEVEAFKYNEGKTVIKQHATYGRIITC